MAKVTIEVPAEFSFRRGDAVMTVDPQKLVGHPHILTRLGEYSLTRKVGVAAAGKYGEDAKAAMQAAWDTLCAGDWGRTRESNVDPLQRHRLEAFAHLLKAADELPKEPTIFGKKGAVQQDAHDWLAETLAKQDDATKAVVEGAAAERHVKALEEAKARAAEKERQAAEARENAKGLVIKI